MDKSTLVYEGYKEISVKELDYHSDFSGDELDIISEHKKEEVIRGIPNMVFAVVFMSIFSFGLLMTPEVITPLVIKLIVFLIMFLIACLAMLMPLLSIFGKKQVCTATVACGRKTRSYNASNKRHHTHYYAVVYKSEPQKVFADNIPISSTYNSIYGGERIIVVKTPANYRGYLL